MTKQTTTMGSCFRVDALESCVQKTFEKQLTQDPLEACLVHDANENDTDQEEVMFNHYLNANPALNKKQSTRYEPLPSNVSIVSTMKEDSAPKVELKPLPSSLRYAFLGQNSTYPVIVNAELNDE